MSEKVLEKISEAEKLIDDAEGMVEGDGPVEEVSRFILRATCLELKNVYELLDPDLSLGHDGYDELYDRSYSHQAKETVSRKGTKGGENQNEG